MSRNARIRELRKNGLNLTQEQFSAILGFQSRGKITGIELAGAPVEDNFIDLICRIYPQVNREWLADGIGEMFKERSREEEIAEYAAALINEEDSFKKRLIEALLKANDETWNRIEKFLKDISC